MFLSQIYEAVQLFYYLIIVYFIVYVSVLLVGIIDQTLTLTLTFDN